MFVHKGLSDRWGFLCNICRTFDFLYNKLWGYVYLLFTVKYVHCMCLLLQCGNAFVLDCNTVWICMLHVLLYTHYKLGRGGHILDLLSCVQENQNHLQRSHRIVTKVWHPWILLYSLAFILSKNAHLGRVYVWLCQMWQQLQSKMSTSRIKWDLIRFNYVRLRHSVSFFCYITILKSKTAERQTDTRLTLMTPA